MRWASSSLRSLSPPAAKHQQTGQGVLQPSPISWKSRSSCGVRLAGTSIDAAPTYTADSPWDGSPYPSWTVCRRGRGLRRSGWSTPRTNRTGLLDALTIWKTFRDFRIGRGGRVPGRRHQGIGAEYAPSALSTTRRPDHRDGPARSIAIEDRQDDLEHIAFIICSRSFVPCMARFTQPMLSEEPEMGLVLLFRASAFGHIHDRCRPTGPTSPEALNTGWRRRGSTARFRPEGPRGNPPHSPSVHGRLVDDFGVPLSILRMNAAGEIRPVTVDHVGDRSQTSARTRRRSGCTGW